MNFEVFLSTASTPAFWAPENKFFFKGDTFCPLFFSSLFSYTEKNNLLPFTRNKIDPVSSDKKTIISTLSQSVLGQDSFFWLGNISAITTQDIHQYLASYQGPHTITYFIAKESKAAHHHKGATVDIPANIDYALFEQLLSFFKQTFSPTKKSVIKKIFKEVKTLELDTACMLINYLELIPAKSSAEFEGYLAHLINAQPSLSQLSEYFFAKNATLFWPVWTKVNTEYPEMFWLSFWSDQVWRAYHAINFLKKNEFVKAKKISYRLPYSFLNQHWKKFSLEELRQLYEELYRIDYAIKKGSTFFSLDLFYFNFFLGKIRTS